MDEVKKYFIYMTPEGDIDENVLERAAELQVYLKAEKDKVEKKTHLDINLVADPNSYLSFVNIISRTGNDEDKIKEYFAKRNFYSRFGKYLTS